MQVFDRAVAKGQDNEGFGFNAKSVSSFIFTGNLRYVSTITPLPP